MNTKERAARTYAAYEKRRRQKNLTDYAVSKATGIAVSTLSDWKRGLSVPKADKMIILAKTLDMPAEELM